MGHHKPSPFSPAPAAPSVVSGQLGGEQQNAQQPNEVEQVPSELCGAEGDVDVCEGAVHPPHDQVGQGEGLGVAKTDV